MKTTTLLITSDGCYGKKEINITLLSNISIILNPTKFFF